MKSTGVDMEGLNMEIPKIHEGEYRFCLIMWEHEPIAAAQLTKLCQEQLGWKRTTTYTVIKRLGERGVLKNEDGIVTALVSKDEAQACEIDELVEKYPDEFDGIAASEFLGNGQIRQDKNTYANVSVQGTTSEYIDYMKLKMYAGRNLTKQDNKTKKNVCIVADTMAKQYFGDENPIGEQITYAGSDGNLYNFTIVGIYEYNAALFGKVDTSVPEKDRSTTMFIPIQTCFKLMGKDQSGYTNFNLMVNSLADIDQATTDVTNFFEEKYANNKNFHVTTYNMASDMGMINTVINVITIAVSGIALISLIVGGVGVMNIMLVSITERTREIGVRMALGAKRSTIRMQFVIEAIVLCIFGGMIGILIGVFNGFVLGKAAEFVIQNMYSEYSSYIIMSVRPSLSAIVLSLFFSMLTGVFFGYYPANKAAKMEVIDALRYE